MNPAEFANIARSEREFWWYRGMREIMFRLLDPVVAQGGIRRALEAGCGTGHFAKVLGERYGLPVAAIDYGMEGLCYARGMGLQAIAQSDVRALPFNDGAFDLVLSMDVIVHFERGSEGAALREMARVLAPGGTLAIRASALDLLRSRHSQFAHERQRFTRTRLKKAVEAVGLEVVRATYANMLLMPVALAKFRIWEPLTNAPPSSGVEPVAEWLNAALHVPLAIEASMIGRGWNLPLGQSLVLLARWTRH